MDAKNQNIKGNPKKQGGSGHVASRIRSALKENKRTLLGGAAVLAALIVAWLIPSPLTDHESAVKRFVDAERVSGFSIDTVGMKLPDGSVYDGDLLEGTTMRQGYGRLTAANGFTYEGEWKGNRLDFGICTTPTYVYEGNFNENLQSNGYGIINYSKSLMDVVEHGESVPRMYIGNWKDGEKHGLGRTVFADGSMQFGHYDRNEFQPVHGQDFEVGERVYGMDVSHHQGDIDWSNLALYCDSKGVAYKGKIHKSKYIQPVFFVYVKATEGATYIDPTYAVRIIEASHHGLTKGAYHFMRLGSDVKEQVKNFLTTATWTRGDMPPALDIEDEKEIRQYGVPHLLNWVYTWLEDVETSMRVRPIIYTTEKIRDNYLRKDPRFAKYQCWIARYREAGPESNVWRIWQFTEKGKVSGYKGSIDGNIFKGGYGAFQNYLNTLPI